MGLVGRHVGLRVSCSDCLGEQVGRATADVAADLLLAQGRKPIQTSDVVYRRGDCGIAVDQSAVQVEQDGAKS